MKTCQKAIEVGLKKIDSLENDKDHETAKQIIEMLRENLQIWEDIDPNKESDDDDYNKKETKKNEDDD